MNFMAPNVDCNLCVTVSKFGKWGTCGKRPILADFAAYHLNNLNGKINGSRRENIRSAIRNQNDKSGCQRVTSSCRSLFWRCPDYGTCHFPCLILFPWMYSPLQSISLPSLLHFVLKMIFPDQISSILYSHLYVGPYYLTTKYSLKRHWP